MRTKKPIITFWIPFAVMVVIGRRILDYGFNKNVFKSGFISELLLGIIVCIIVVIIDDNKQNKKENK